MITRNLPIMVITNSHHRLSFFDTINSIMKGIDCMEKNIYGALLIFINMNIKPNFSELEREYGIDRHTIAKYWKNGGIKHVKVINRAAMLDKYYDEIVVLLNKPGVNKKGAYEFLCDKYGKELIGSESNFRHYTQKKDLKPKKGNNLAHVRFECPPGKQLQNDWKESMRLHDRNGNEYVFNILSSTLAYSRFHVFIYSKGKTTEDYLRTTIDTLNRIGGCPDEILTDNMSAIVSITNGSKEKHKKIKAFEKDTGIKIRLCKVRSPETKGKDEVSNCFMTWLYAYDYEFDNENELISIIEKINHKVNNQINQTTKIPPYILFQKEKEYLKPLPNKVLLDSYVDTSFTQTVPSTLLVNYKGNGYSVPAKYNGKKVKVYVIDNKLYIYFNTELINIHDITASKFNYKVNDYKSGLATVFKSNDIDIDEVVKENLKLFDKMKGIK